MTPFPLSDPLSPFPDKNKDMTPFLTPFLTPFPLSPFLSPEFMEPNRSKRREAIEFSKLTSANLMQGEDQEDSVLLRGMLAEAKAFLSSFAWNRGIRESFLGLGVGGVVGVFLFHIVPSRSDVDEWLWVIVGDLPPAYITTENAPNAACALDAYIGAMREWVEAARAGRSVDQLIPVNVPPSLENAENLHTRLEFLKKEILSKSQ